MARRSLLLLLVAAVAALAAVAWLVSNDPGPQLAASADAAVPMHYFVPAASADGEVQECRLTAVENSLWEIWSRTLASCTLDGGWTGASSWGAWAFGASSTATLALDSTDWDLVTVRARAYSGLPEGVEQTLRVFLNGHDLGTEPVPFDMTDVAFAVPPEVLRFGPNQVELVFAHRASPAEAGRGKDERPLAAAVELISLRRSAGGGHGQRQTPSVQVFDRRSGRYLIQESGDLVIPTSVPAGASALVVEAALPGGAAREGVAVKITARSIDDSWGASDLLAPGTARCEIPVSGAAGELCLITISATLPQGSGPIEVPSIAYVVDGADRPEGLKQEDRDRRPDIVLITLDAARPDHFSGYGYSRPTTPSIDRLADRALVFRNAFALAPYTLCSVPTMITGLSFFNHGVTSHDHTLAPDATTLAEYLKAAGYRTACFSATPNNSSAKGFDQGYDEFFELWREAGRNTSRRPHYVTRRVSRWLESVDDERPLHLQIHYIPPHAPYEPDDRFNLFTEPSYRGPCNGKFKTLSGLETGRLDPGEGCLEHVIGLYDGNLRAADDAVGKLLAALRSRDRWRDTVVLITSDHGEAFLEHGRMHHNSTVYDEMLAVPFILRVPPWLDVSNVDTSRLVSLADILPTLLGTAGIRAAHAVDGVDLLGSPEAVPRSRFLVACNTDKPPLLGLRTLRWKAILAPSGQGWLFDLEQDPGETRSLALDHPATFTGLGLMLTERATAPRSLAPGAEAAEITDQDRDMLRALGYLDAADSD